MRRPSITKDSGFSPAGHEQELIPLSRAKNGHFFKWITVHQQTISARYGDIMVIRSPHAYALAL